MAKSPSESPWHVVTDEGALHSGHASEDAANSAAKQCNDKGKNLGLRTAYKVIPKPE